jgi:hypothetical protein
VHSLGVSVRTYFLALVLYHVSQIKRLMIIMPIIMKRYEAISAIIVFKFGEGCTRLVKTM